MGHYGLSRQTQPSCSIRNWQEAAYIEEGTELVDDVIPLTFW